MRKIKNKRKAIYLGFPILIWDEWDDEIGYVTTIGGIFSIIPTLIDSFFRTCLWDDSDFMFFVYKGNYFKALLRYLGITNARE